MYVDLNTILKEKITFLDNQIKEAEKTRDSAPSPMESKSDKTRQDFERLIFSLQDEKRNFIHLQKNLVKLPKFTSKVNLNTQVTLKSEAGEKSFFIVPEGLGGITVNNLYLLSDKTPLAKCFLNQKINHQFTFNNTNYKITSIKENK